MWIYHVRTKQVSNIDLPGAIIDPRFSPDAKFIAGVVNASLYLYCLDTKSGKIILANENENVTYGLVDFIAAEELNRYRGFWWSPDSDRLVVERVDESQVTTVQITDPDNPAAETRNHRYPFAGSKNPDCDFFVTDLEGNKSKLEIDKNEFEYVTDVDFNSLNTVNLTLLTRDQKTMVLKQFNLNTKSQVDLWAQNHPAWVEVIPGSPQIFENHLITLDGKDHRSLFVDGLALTDSSHEVRAILNWCWDKFLWVR